MIRFDTFMFEYDTKFSQT